MSKRWKIRKRNAAKRERSREIIAQFHDNVKEAFLREVRRRLDVDSGRIDPTRTEDEIAAEHR